RRSQGISRGIDRGRERICKEHDAGQEPLRENRAGLSCCRRRRGRQTHSRNALQGPVALDLEEQEQLATLKGWWKDNGNLVVGLITAIAVGFSGWQAWQWY